MYRGDIHVIKRLSLSLMQFSTRIIKLTSIDIQWVAIGPEGAKWLSRAVEEGSCRNLQSLNLKGNYIYVCGVRTLIIVLMSV